MKFSTILSVASLAGLVAALPVQQSELEARQFGMSRNDLNAPCKDVYVVFARGTTEPGNMGAVAGPPFVSALTSKLRGKSVGAVGVDYPASVSGYLTGGKMGAQTMAKNVQTLSTKCPSAKVVMSGYSQGAQVTHSAAALIPASVHPNIAAVVVFGDPMKGKAFPGALNSKVKTFCNMGDLICTGAPMILPPHLTYGTDAGAAANFVVSKLGAS